MPLILTLLIGWILYGIEMDMFVPSLPEMRNIFGISTFLIELTIGVNCIAHCIASLFVGNLGDNFGYRPILLYCMVIFVIGSILCCFASYYEILLLGRFLQGIGMAGTTTLAYLILTNIYSTQKQQEILGLLNGVITIVMTLAPLIGSYIALLFGWRGNFIALLVIGLLNLLCSYLFIPQHSPQGNASLSLKEYSIIFQSKKTMDYILLICFSVVPYWIFIAISPILYMEGMGVKLEMFGFYQGALALIFSIFSFANGLLIRNFGTLKYVYFGIICYLVFIILCLITVFLGVNNPIIITLLMLLLSIGTIIPCNIFYPMMFEILPESKGKTSALLTSLRMIVIATGIQFVSYFYDGTFFTLGLIICLFVILNLFFTYRLLIQKNEITKLN
ncbi:MAG UNVERIFIED_CONTAM: MFS transporter [Rickettsiaceae bacterium]|jgi:DHA1 family bicyclomycin/chloramphenicol resistance-like MFS transporter